MNKILIDAIKNYKVKIINISNIKENDFNNRVKKIYVINLVEDVIKRNYITILMKKYNINFTFVIVDRIPSNLYNSLKKYTSISAAEMGCCLSHMWCLYQIIKSKYENALIFEDDIILHKHFIHHFLSINAEKLDFLLLGAHDFCFSKINHNNVSKNLYRPNSNSIHLYGAHANYYSLRGAKIMFNIRMSEFSFFDKEYMLMFNYFKDTSFICYPNLVVTNITTSKLDHQREILGDSEKEYYYKCFINFNFKNYNYIYINILNKTIDINKYDNYESYMDACLYVYFYNLYNIEIVKKRLVMDFFTMADIKQILYLQL